MRCFVPGHPSNAERVREFLPEVVHAAVVAQVVVDGEVRRQVAVAEHYRDYLVLPGVWTQYNRHFSHRKVVVASVTNSGHVYVNSF